MAVLEGRIFVRPFECYSSHVSYFVEVLPWEDVV